MLKFAHHTGARAIAGRFTPGTFTNQVQKNFYEPRLLIVCDPQNDRQPIIESSFQNIPTIAFCNSDANLQFVDALVATLWTPGPGAASLETSRSSPSSSKR